MSADLNLSDLAPLLPMATHAATIPPPWSLPAPKPQTLTGKWCAHCAKDSHDDAECWSTRSANP